MFSSKAARSATPKRTFCLYVEGEARLRTPLEDILSVMTGWMFKKANGKAAGSEDSRRTLSGTSKIRAPRERSRWAFSTSSESRSGGMADTHV